VRIFGSSSSFIGNSSYFFVSETDVVFSTRSAIVRNQQRQTDSGRSGSGGAPSTRSREDEGFLKDLVVIFCFFVVA
jgi:hypothetical protein